MFQDRSIHPVLVTLILLLFAGPARAGTLCGHLSDSDTGAPIGGAAVVLRDSLGAPTGLLTGSDAQGDFCLSEVPPGVYTLEVRLDDYLVAWRRGVTVADDVSSAPVSLQVPPFALFAPWPNPASGAVNLRLQMLRTAPIDLAVHDARGRVVRRWSGDDLEAGSRVFLWDGRDTSGLRVPAGAYLVQARSRGFVVSRRLVVIH